ncbi:MAG: hypothetical protein JSU77_12205 [Fidelibacterota bacterium]|nr:MAG: hypothetical protein JSU77_12205 [Candidatus Neomarinimicrobiota bacterium]
MEISNTLIQGLAQAIIGGGQQAPQPPAPPAAEPSAGTVEPSAARIVAPEQAAEQIQVNQSEDGNGVLTSGEKEILDLFFNGQEEMDLTFYGPQPSKPGLLGNFLDVRG